MTPLRRALRGNRRLLRSTVEASSGHAKPNSASHTPVPERPSVTGVRLHEEIAEILREHGNRWMTTQEVADLVNARGRYRKKDGTTVSAFQVHGRTRNYLVIFEREGSRVRLREGS
jgi:hypothetical protein